MPDPVEVTRDAPRLPQNATDPNVHVPSSVKAAAEAAEAAHQRAYTPPEPQVTAPATPEPPPTPEPTDLKATERANWTVEQWRHHALSTEGRYKAQQTTLHQMQDQAAQLAEELIRTQAIRQEVKQPPVKTEPLLTPQDEEQYGRELIDFAKRAALEAVQPELTNLRSQNEQLQRRISKNTVSTVNSTLDQQIPNWRDINVSPEFNAWLNLPDVYSGNVRRNLLKAAHSAADAARVAAFFRGYLTEVSDAGALETLPSSSAAVSPTAPRQAAVPLATLTAPGHARPAVGTNPTDASSKPVITHAQIAKFYANCRLATQGQGPYAGREADRLNDEQFIFECQREGRVR